MVTGWAFTDAAFDATAASFDNPDFVDTVVHSYRHRYDLTAGDPDYEADERVIAGQPEITVPTVVIDAADDPLEAPRLRSVHGQKFPALVDYRVLDTGHNVPQEDPAGFADAVWALREHVRA
jgi:pimeloyl-ACP methyl ester carboxylesterase